ncbi:MAG: hypothetical protein LBM77_13965, partial [Spirochaetaceae bacterium]|nr:hypothetical protein [Spirochaetaceae bacterium]
MKSKFLFALVSVVFVLLSVLFAYSCDITHLKSQDESPEEIDVSPSPPEVELWTSVSNNKV